MPSPVAHTLAGGCVAALAARRLPGARGPLFAGATLLAANLPDLDYAAAVYGRRTMEAFHQGFFHSVGFVLAGTLLLALLVRRGVGAGRAWGVLAAAGVSHLLLDLVAFDNRPPIGFPFLWPATAERFHAAVTIFPGVDRSAIFRARNLRELAVELALLLPALLWLLRRAAPQDARR